MPANAKAPDFCEILGAKQGMGDTLDTSERNYWLRKRLSRRHFVAGSGTAAAGAASLAMVGCGDDDDGSASPTSPGSSNGDTSPTPSPGNGNGNGGARQPSGSLRASLATLMEQSADPRYQSGGLARPINTHTFDSFFRTGDDGQREMNLAETLEVPDDRMSMILKMRPGVKFWDGSEMTVEDVVWSHESFINRSPPQAEAAIVQGRIESVEATDESTVVLTLTEPTAFEGREMPFWFISSQAYYDEVGEDEFRHSGLGSGPFKIVNNAIGEFIELEANPEHWNKERIPYVQSLRLNVVPEQTTRISQIHAGETDIIDGVAGAQAEQLGQEQGIQVVTSEATAMLMIRFVETQEGIAPWTDARLREALVLAMDHQSIVDGLLRQGQPSPNVHLWPGTAGYDPELFPARPFDPERARQLIAEAGLEGFEFTMHSYESSSYPLIPQVMQAVAGFWQDVGVAPTISQGEAGSHFTNFTSRSFDGVAAISFPFYPDAAIAAVNVYQTGSPYGSFDNNEVIDGYVDEILEARDRDEQLAIAQEVHQYVYNEFLMATAPWSDSQWVTTDKVAEWIRPTGDPYMTRLESVQLA